MNKDIKQLFFSKDLTSRTCRECNIFFTLNDYKNDNWDLEVKGCIDLSEFRTNTSKGRIGLLIELKHSQCVEVEKHPPRQDNIIY